VRSVPKGQKAVKALSRDYPTAKIDVWELEMSSYDSIQTFAGKVDTDLPRLDIAILNAGLVKNEMSLNPSTGHEEMIQVNFLSTMLLAILLLPALRTKSPHNAPGRLTIVGSAIAYFAKFMQRNEVPVLPALDTSSGPWDASEKSERYSLSKLLGHLFLPKLAGYVNADDVTVNIVDPGLCKGSGLHRDIKGIASITMSLVKSITGRSMEDGSTTYVDAAVVKGKESHGCFVMDWAIKP
jgi:NAD(P)-dependent dehydrogenase (short-subunit alcohol dehydrogenase family)